jgi:hypothetical protein
MADDGVVLPAGWARLSDPEPGVLAVLTPREAPPSGHLPAVVLTRTPRRPPGFAAEEVLGALGVPGAQVEDEDSYETELGRADYLRVGWRQDGVEMLAEVWTWWHAGDLWALTGCVARADYAAFSDVFEDLAGAFRPAA